MSGRSDCRKFAPNIFNKSKCTNCFRQKEEHSAEALESNRASRKISKCGYLFVAPGWDFSNPLYRTKINLMKKDRYAMNSGFDSVELSKQSLDSIYHGEYRDLDEDDSDDPPSSPDSTADNKQIQVHDDLYGPDDICIDYLPLSASSVRRHVLYNYPFILDPGIEEALLKPLPTTIYPDDGQKLYLDLCKEMSTAPIRRFYTSLLTNKVDLSYYGIDRKGFRALFMALRSNVFVECVDLTDNWMEKDSCYHLGDLIANNHIIKELNLHGCRIGVSGAETFFSFLPYNHHLVKLNISRNHLTDEGLMFLAKAIEGGTSVSDINLCNNKLTDDAVNILTEALMKRNILTHLNLSWNTIYAPITIDKLCKELAKNKTFENLDLSWNSLCSGVIGNAIRILFKKAKALRYLNLRNNRLGDDAVEIIANNINQAKNLHTLDLSNNLFSPKIALLLLEKVKNSDLHLQCLNLENVIVNEEFVKVREEILSRQFPKAANITHGFVITTLKTPPIDIRYLLLKRADVLTAAAKGAANRDFALIILQMKKNDPEPRIVAIFISELKALGLKLDNELIDQIAVHFAGPRAKDKNKSKTIDLDAIIEYIKRLWPEKKLSNQPVVPTVPKSNKAKKSPKKKK